MSGLGRARGAESGLVRRECSGMECVSHSLRSRSHDAPTRSPNFFPTSLGACSQATSLRFDVLCWMASKIKVVLCGLTSLKFGGELSGANCSGGELSGIPSVSCICEAHTIQSR